MERMKAFMENRELSTTPHFPSVPRHVTFSSMEFITEGFGQVGLDLHFIVEKL